MGGILDSGDNGFSPLVSSGGGALGQAAGSMSRDSAQADMRRKLDSIALVLQGMRAEHLQVLSPDGKKLIKARVMCQRGGADDFVVAPVTPFRVELRTNPDNPNRLQYMVGAGTLLATDKPDSSITISGLEEWVNCEDTERIWLEIDVSDAYMATGASIRSSGKGGEFDTSADLTQYGDPGFVTLEEDDSFSKQTKARLMIATIEDEEVRQILASHLVMKRCVQDGIPYIYPQVGACPA